MADNLSPEVKQRAYNLLETALESCYAAELDYDAIVKFVRAHTARARDGKLLDSAAYREKHGCVAVPPKAAAAKAGQ